MKKSMDHERCSELLLPYVRAELEPAARGQVEEHLRSCPDCAEEKAALERLLAVEITPLQAPERDALHRGVAGELAPGAAERKPVARSPGPSRWVRSIPALGAVALIALAVVFGANLLSGGGQVDESAGDGGGGDTALREESSEARGGGAVPEGVPDTTAGGERAKAGAPYFKRGRRVLTEKVLDDLARKEPAFHALSGVSRGRAEILYNSYTDALSDQAPENSRAQVRTCTRSVAASQGTVLPAYGTEGRYRGKDALLVGFVAGTNSGPLNRYMLWLWPKGSCEVPLGYVSGALKK